jgi:hypothetical protein
MLTFEQALLMLKSGEDMRHADWPSGHFVRAVQKPVVRLVRFKTGGCSDEYRPTQLEMFSNQWGKA